MKIIFLTVILVVGSASAAPDSQRPADDPQGSNGQQASQPNTPTAQQVEAGKGNKLDAFMKSYGNKTPKGDPQAELRRNVALALKTAAHGAQLYRKSYDPATNTAGFLGIIETLIYDLVVNKIIDIIVRNVLKNEQPQQLQAPVPQ